MPRKPSITPSEAQELPYPYRPDTLELLDKEPRSGIFINETLLRETNIEDFDSFNMLYAKVGRTHEREPADEGVEVPTQKKKRRRRKRSKTGLLFKFKENSPNEAATFQVFLPKAKVRQETVTSTPSRK